MGSSGELQDLSAIFLLDFYISLEGKIRRKEGAISSVLTWQFFQQVPSK